MDKYSELEVLKRLLDDGAITQEEYQEEKAKILAGYGYEYSDAPWGMDENVYCTFMH